MKILEKITLASDQEQNLIVIALTLIVMMLIEIAWKWAPDPVTLFIPIYGEATFYQPYQYMFLELVCFITLLFRVLIHVDIPLLYGKK